MVVEDPHPRREQPRRLVGVTEHLGLGQVPVPVGVGVGGLVRLAVTVVVDLHPVQGPPQVRPERIGEAVAQEHVPVAVRVTRLHLETEPRHPRRPVRVPPRRELERRHPGRAVREDRGVPDVGGARPGRPLPAVVAHPDPGCDVHRLPVDVREGHLPPLHDTVAVGDRHRRVAHTVTGVVDLHGGDPPPPVRPPRRHPALAEDVRQVRAVRVAGLHVEREGRPGHPVRAPIRRPEEVRHLRHPVLGAQPLVTDVRGHRPPRPIPAVVLHAYLRLHRTRPRVGVREGQQDVAVAVRGGVLRVVRGAVAVVVDLHAVDLAVEVRPPVLPALAQESALHPCAVRVAHLHVEREARHPGHPVRVPVGRPEEVRHLRRPVRPDVEVVGQHAVRPVGARVRTGIARTHVPAGFGRAHAVVRDVEPVLSGAGFLLAPARCGEAVARRWEVPGLVGTPVVLAVGGVELQVVRPVADVFEEAVRRRPHDAGAPADLVLHEDVDRLALDDVRVVEDRAALARRFCRCPTVQPGLAALGLGGSGEGQGSGSGAGSDDQDEHTEVEQVSPDPRRRRRRALVEFGGGSSHTTRRSCPQAPVQQKPPTPSIIDRL